MPIDPAKINPNVSTWFVPKKGLMHLTQYQYKCIDKSWITNHIMHPFWNLLIDYLIPAKMAYVKEEEIFFEI